MPDLDRVTGIFVVVTTHARQQGHRADRPAMAMPVFYRYSCHVNPATSSKTDADRAQASGQGLERLETRASPEARERILAAAAATNESLAKFILRASLKETDEVLGRPVDVTRMPVEQFEALLAALDEPGDVVEPLAAIAARPRRGIRR